MRKLALCLTLLVSGAFAQNNSPMSISTEEHGPGDRLTLFVTFREPMPEVGGIWCNFDLSAQPNPQQTLLSRNFSCDGSAQKDKDGNTQYRTLVTIPQDAATGEYKLSNITIKESGVNKNYQGGDVPAFSLKVKNPKDQPNFSPIKDVSVK